MATSSGCGTVFYGRTQKVMLSSSPPGAAASLANVQTTTPGEVRLPRNQPNGWAVFRAAAPGYQPACTLVRGPFKAKYLVLDGLFAGLPMLIDLIGMGSLNALRQYPETASLTLRPLEPGETPRPLPSDAEVIHFRRLTWIDLCQPTALKSASVAATQCDSPTTHIEGAGGDEAMVWWTYHCGDNRFGCISDRRFAHVTCTSSDNFADPFAYCASVGTIDAPDARYIGPHVPEAIAKGLRRAFDAPADAPLDPFLTNSFWRCLNGRVYACTVGANLPCMVKANIERTPTTAEVEFCKSNAQSDFIPMVVTGRDTVYEWRCRNGAPEIVRQVTTPDARGFLSNTGTSCTPNRCLAGWRWCLSLNPTPKALRSLAQGWRILSATTLGGGRCLTAPRFLEPPRLG